MFVLSVVELCMKGGYVQETQKRLEGRNLGHGFVQRQMGDVELIDLNIEIIEVGNKLGNRPIDSMVVPMIGRPMMGVEKTSMMKN